MKPLSPQAEEVEDPHYRPKRLHGLVHVDRAASYVGGYGEFNAGTLSIHTSGQWFEPVDSINHGVAPLPRGSASPATPLYIDPYIMSAKTKHPEAAMKVLEFFLSEDVAELFILRDHIGVPLHRETTLRLLPDMFGSIPIKEKMVWIDAVNYARNVPFTANWSDLMRAVQPHLDRLGRNQAPAEVVAMEMARLTNALMAEMENE